jgi:hypothetical protein
MNSTMVIIDVNAHELTDASCPPKFSELCHEAQRVSSKADNGPVYVDHKGVGSVYLRSCGETDI